MVDDLKPKQYQPYMFYTDSTPKRWHVLESKKHIESDQDALPWLQGEYETELTLEDIECRYEHPFGGLSLDDRPIVFRGGWCYTVSDVFLAREAEV